jgi:2-dehydropantoate 2-reductase
MKERLKLLVFGAGAIGTYIGGSLAAAGHSLVFLEQPGAVQALCKTGLRLDLSIAGRPVLEIPPESLGFAASLEEALTLGPYDFAVFALKSFDTAAAVEAMKPFAGRLPPLLCLSNGVDNELALEAGLGVGQVIPGTVTSSIGRRAAGDIVLERLRGVGVAEGHPLALFVAEALNDAGLNVRLLHSAASMKWSKMLTNLPANAIAAIVDMAPGEVFSVPGLFRLEMRMLREALQVMRRLGVRVIDLPGVPVRLLALGTRLPGFIARPLMQKAVGGGRGGKMPSFHIDLHSGRGKSEVEWLNGAVVRYGDKAGVKTPVNRLLTSTLLSLTSGELSLDAFSRQPEVLINLIEREQ